MNKVAQIGLRSRFTKNKLKWKTFNLIIMYYTKVPAFFSLPRKNNYINWSCVYIYWQTRNIRWQCKHHGRLIKCQPELRQSQQSSSYILWVYFGHHKLLSKPWLQTPGKLLVRLSELTSEWRNRISNKLYTSKYRCRRRMDTICYTASACILSWWDPKKEKQKNKRTKSKTQTSAAVSRSCMHVRHLRRSLVVVGIIIYLLNVRILLSTSYFNSPRLLSQSCRKNHVTSVPSPSSASIIEVTHTFTYQHIRCTW